MKACILMATRDGAAFLPAQLASIAAQRGVDWRLVAADDGSQDETPAILARFAARHPAKVMLCAGPGQGAAANFLGLLAHARVGEAVAFADQDDVWLPDKLAQAGHWLRAEGGVAAWSCRTRVCDRDLRPLTLGPAPRRASFRNALVQNILAGNTLVLSPDAAGLIRRSLSAPEAQMITAHDWWCYQMVAGAGGRIFTDPRPLVLYRQHDGNAAGHRGGWRAHLARARALWEGDFGAAIAAHHAALLANTDLLMPEVACDLRRFGQSLLRGRIFPAHRHAWADHAALAACAALGRLNQAKGGAQVSGRSPPFRPAAP